MSSPANNLASRLLDPALVAGWGNRVAIREGDAVWSYAQLHDNVTRLSTALRTLRICRGDRVAVLMRDSRDAAAALLGIWHAGAVAVPISELARPIEVRDYLIDSGAVAAIVYEELEPTLDQIRAEVPALREVLCTSARSAGEREFYTLVRAAAPAREAAAVNPDDVAMILYSAGGREQRLRGVPHCHQTPINAFESFGRGVVGLAEGDRVLSVGRLATAYGLGTALVYPLAAGAETILLPEQPHSETLFARIRAAAPTILFATPSVYSQLAHDADAAGKQAPLGALRACISGAEGMPTELIPRIREILGTEVIVGYGLTEAFQFVLATAAVGGAEAGCGRPVRGFEARIVGDDGRPLGPDSIGTLQIRGRTVLRAYWGRENHTEDDDFVDGWFTTRDRFMKDERGNFYHCGRRDGLFKVGGKWVSPAEVERALIAHEAVWECAVVGVPDKDGLIKPLAYVVPNVGHTPSRDLAKELRAYIKNELAPYKYPRRIEFVETLPKGPHGKLLRYKLAPPTMEMPAARPDEA